MQRHRAMSRSLTSRARRATSAIRCGTTRSGPLRRQVRRKRIISHHANAEGCSVVSVVRSQECAGCTSFSSTTLTPDPCRAHDGYSEYQHDKSRDRSDNTDDDRCDNKRRDREGVGEKTYGVGSAARKAHRAVAQALADVMRAGSLGVWWCLTMRPCSCEPRAQISRCTAA